MTSDAQHAATAVVEINRGAVGMVGASRVGVVAVTSTRPPVQGAMPAATADLTVAYEVRGVGIENTWTLSEGMLLPLDGGAHRVSKVVTPVTSDSRGNVAIDADAASPLAVDAVFAGDPGRLRIGGPDVDAATDLRILSFAPDRHAPQSATVEWLPAAYARSDTPASNIRQQSIKVGDRLTLGRTMLVVTSIEGDSRDHPARIEFRLSAGR